MRVNAQFPAALIPTIAVLHLVGCSTTLPDRPERMQRGYTYYLDGAGGGSVISNWSRGVRDGLRDAGYDGAGEMFRWETGLGVLADQVASEDYKRKQARKLAAEIQSFHRAHPNAKISLIGLSAGTVISVFALEALPRDVPVDTVVLLSGSLSANYDLTKALQRVRDRIYVFSSRKDTVLQGLLPFVGTADRAKGTTDTIGVQGPQLPRGASRTTQQLYADRMVEIPWNPEFAAYGHHGGHTDTVKADFVRHFVAPFLAPLNPTKAEPISVKRRGKVPNPDYRRWARFEPGAWATYTLQPGDPASQPSQDFKATLTFKSDAAALVKRELIGPSRGQQPLIRRDSFVTATVDPHHNPLTDPDARITELPDEIVSVAGRDLACTVFTARSTGDTISWGRDVTATVYASDRVPGGIVKLDLRTSVNDRSLHYLIQLTDFGARQ